MDSGNKKNLIITVFFDCILIRMGSRDSRDATANSFQKILTTTLHGDTVHHMETIYITAS